MANHKSAEKRHRQSLKRRLRNRQVKSRFRTAVKKARIAIDSGAENAAELTLAAEREVAKAATKGIIHKNAAARYTSRLMSKATKSAESAAAQSA